MAYKLKEQRIVPGGLNLLAPGDQVAEGDCLDLSDWWAGSAGRLEQAPTLVVKNSPTVIAVQHSLCQADGRIYYSGIAGELRQVGRSAEASLDSGYDTTPLGIFPYPGYCWIMNRSRQKKDDGTTVSDWTPAVPGAPSLYDLDWDGSAAGAATPATAVGNPPEIGAHAAEAAYYYITWQYGTLGESNPSTVATITPAPTAPHLGSIIRITQSTPPATATGWNIYRKVSGTVYRLNEGTIDIARTYVDDYGDEVHTHSDTQMLQLGIIMESDHDAAPAARVIANQVYNGRILVASSASFPNRIWYSPALQPAFFRGSANPNVGDWVDVGTDKGDAVLVMICHKGYVVIYRQRSIWVHTGDFGADNGGRLDVVVPDMGTVSVRGVTSTTLGDYFGWNDGVYKFNGDWAQKVSPKVEPVFRGLATENLAIAGLMLGVSQRAKMALGYKNGRLWVSYANAAGQMAQSLILDVPSQRWFNSNKAYGAFLDTGDDFLGADAGVYSLEKSYIGGATLLSYQSEYQDCGFPDREKTFADLVIEHNTQGITLTVKIRKNRNVLGSGAGGDEFTIGTITSTSLTREVIPLTVAGTYTAGHPELGTQIKAYNLSILIAGNGAQDTPIVIESPMILHYYLEARKGKSFDSDETDHGIPEVKIVDQVEFDIDQPNTGALLQVYSDSPGGDMAAREGSGMAIAQTVGRRMAPIVLTTPAVGRLLRYTVTDPNTHQIYGVRVRILPIGVYLDGTVSDFWQPQPVSIGV